MGLFKRYFGYNKYFKLKDKNGELIATINVQAEPYILQVKDGSFQVKIINETNKRLKRYHEVEGLIAVIEPNSDFTYTVTGLGITREGLDGFGKDLENGIEEWKIEEP